VQRANATPSPDAAAAIAGYKLGQALADKLGAGASSAGALAPQGTATDQGTRAVALDALGAALVAAEQHLFKLNLGVQAAVLLVEGIPDDRGEYERIDLWWGKLNGKWCLYVRDCVVNDSDTWSETPLLQASADLRRRAAKALPELLRQLRSKKTEEIEEINEATAVALAFARGEYDHE
jgi:hypothetical protein